MTIPDRDARVQRAILFLLHHFHPASPTRTELHRMLLDNNTSDDDAQRAIDDLASLGVIGINRGDETVRLPLPVLMTLELAEQQHPGT